MITIKFHSRSTLHNYILLDDVIYTGDSLGE